MNSTAKRAGKVIHPRLPDDLHTAVMAYAEASERSLNNAVVYLVRRGLEAEAQGQTR